MRETGGLADTIHEQGDKPNGFVFEAYTSGEMLAAVRRAVAAYQDKKAWKKLMNNAFRCDFSWTASAKRYVALYEAAASAHI